MVGNRAEDISAARAHGVRGVAAGWGHGSRAELAAAAPNYLAETARIRESCMLSRNGTGHVSPKCNRRPDLAANCIRRLTRVTHLQANRR